MTTAGTRVSPLQMTAGEALEAHRLVRMSGSSDRTVVYADSGERAIGVTLAKVASGEKVAVEMLNGARTLKVIAAGTITRNAGVYTANDGKVSDSVAGEKLGILLTTGAAGEPAELVPYGMSGGDLDSDQVIVQDDFIHYTDGDEWLLDANNGGVVTETDAHGGVISITASDTTDGDNDETYVISNSEIFLPAEGAYAGEIIGTFSARVKLTEGNTDDANILFGLLGGDTTDVENSLLDDGAGLADANQWIAMYKVDGTLAWQAAVRDTALDVDTNVGAYASATWYDLKIVISDPTLSDSLLQAEFFVNGVSGGTKEYATGSATAMRLILGVKNGGTGAPAGGEALLVDKIRAEFKRA